MLSSPGFAIVKSAEKTGGGPAESKEEEEI